MSSKTSYSTRFSYASSDMAGQLVFGVVSFYIFKFYTDVVGLSAGVAGTIMLIARFEDALDTPVWGILLDKTKSKYGKSRPWFLRLCIPFSIFGVLTFWAPDLDGSGKAIYAALTYIVLGSIYTGINTPVTSILSALTADPKERVTLTCYRMFGSKLGVLAMNATFMPIVGLLGQGDDKKGYLLTMPLFALGSLLLYLLAFRNLEEKVPCEQEPMPVKKAFKAFKSNWPWIIIFVSCFSFWIAFIARITVVPHFFEYAWGNKELVPLVNSLDFLSLGSIFMIPFFCKWARKGTVWAWGLGLSAVSQGVLYYGVATHSMPLLMTGWITGILTSGVAMALPFSLLADSVDYGEWKTGVRSAGLLTAIGTAFSLKGGSGLGGAIPAWIMEVTGYQANQVQTAEAIKGIEIGFIWVPAVFYIIALVPVLFYRKYEDMEPTIQEALRERRGLEAD